MKQVKLTIIHNDIWSINETCYEKYVGSFLERIFQKYVSLKNNYILSMYNMYLEKKVYFIIIDEMYQLLTLNSRVPKELKIIAINIDELNEKERQYIFDENIKDYIYSRSEIFQTCIKNVGSEKKSELFDEKAIKIIKKVISIKKNNTCDNTSKKINNNRIQHINLKVYRVITNGIKLVKPNVEKTYKIVRIKEHKTNNNRKKDNEKKYRLIDNNKKTVEVKHKPSKIEVIVVLKEKKNSLLTLFSKDDSKSKTFKNNQDGVKKETVTIKEKKYDNLENSSNIEHNKTSGITKVKYAIFNNNKLPKADDYNSKKTNEIGSTSYYDNGLYSDSINIIKRINTSKKPNLRRINNLNINQTSSSKKIDINDNSMSNQIFNYNKKKIKKDDNKNNYENKKIIDKKIEETIEINNEQSQIISYTIILPTGEILYHMEKTLINPISVEDLLLQTGLDINNSNGFVESINGISNQGMSGWVYEVNNVPVMVSASDYIVKSNDTITWKYVDFSKTEENKEQNKSTKKVLHKKTKI